MIAIIFVCNEKKKKRKKARKSINTERSKTPNVKDNKRIKTNRMNCFAIVKRSIVRRNNITVTILDKSTIGYFSYWVL